MHALFLAAADPAHGTTATTAEQPAEHKGGLPQMDASTFASQLFWLVLTFGFLYVVMSRIALPRVGAVLEARRDRISDDLDKAALAKRQSDEAIKSYEASLADARARARAAVEESRKTAQAAADAKSTEAGQRFAAEAAKADQRIEQMRMAALGNIRNAAAEAASSIVAKLTGDTVATDDAARAVDAALARDR